MPGLHLLDRAGRNLAELERAERHPDQAVHRKAEMAQHVLHLAVLALAHGEGEPHIGALLAVERGLDRPIAHAVDLDTAAQAVELRLGGAAERAHAIAPQPAGLRQLEHAREPAVVGQEQEALAIEVEPADADEARQLLRQSAEYGRAALDVGVCGDQPARLMVEKQARALARRQRLAVDADAVMLRHVERGRGDDRAVDGNAPGRDPLLGFAPRREPGARDHLGDALAGSLFALVVLARHEGSAEVMLPPRETSQMPPLSFMQFALAEARAAQERGEVPIGCVIVRDGSVIAGAGNRTLGDRDPTAHAELIAIRAAAQAIGSERLIGCDLHVTLEPCAMCAAAISFARIRRLYYGAAIPRAARSKTGYGSSPRRPATTGPRSMAASARRRRRRC